MTRDELLREAMIFISKVFEDKSIEVKLRLSSKKLLNKYFSIIEKKEIKYE